MKNRIFKFYKATLLISALAFTACSHERALERKEDKIGATEWRSYNHNLTSQRFSPLKQITAENVGRLKQKCTFNLNEKTMFESGPIVVEGILYVTTLTNTYAVDASTCTLIWKNHSDRDPGTAGMGSNRGAAYSDGMIFRGLNAGYLIALDAKTGVLLWEIKIASKEVGESLPAAPVVWRNFVYIGTAGGDMAGVRGRLMAFDIKTGRSIWSFFLVPYEGEATKSWPEATSDNPIGGGATWASYTVDEARGLIYTGTGNATPDFDIEKRPGRNLYTNSIVILDARNGKFKNSYQVTPNDFHDWDAATAPVLITTALGRRMVLEAGKDGLLHGIDLDQGREHYATAVTTRENVDKPITTKGTRFCPGTTGSSVWNGPSFNPELNLIYVNSVDICNTMRLNPHPSKGVIGTPYTGAIPSEPFGKPDPKSKWKGWVTAVDADTGFVRWKHLMKAPVPGAITSTAGGIVFSGDLNGSVLAFDGKSGKVLFVDSVGDPIGGGLISYSVKEKQYIAVAVGFDSKNWASKSISGKVVIYAL